MGMLGRLGAAGGALVSLPVPGGVALRPVCLATGAARFLVVAS